MHSAHGWRTLGFLLLALLLLPLNAALLHAYGRARDRHFDPAIPPVPTVGKTVAALGRMRPDLAEADLRTVYRADPAPRSGLARAYAVGQGPTAAYLAVVRHDIDCSSCRDVVAAVIWDSARSVRQRYQVFRLPSAVLVDPMGRVRAGAHGATCVDRLMPACQAPVRRGP